MVQYDFGGLRQAYQVARHRLPWMALGQDKMQVIRLPSDSPGSLINEEIPASQLDRPFESFNRLQQQNQLFPRSPPGESPPPVTRAGGVFLLCSFQLFPP